MEAVDGDAVVIEAAIDHQPEKKSLQQPSNSKFIKAIYQAYLKRNNEDSARLGQNQEEESNVAYLQRLLEEELKKVVPKDELMAKDDAKQLFEPNNHPKDTESYEQVIRSNQRMLGKIFSPEELDFLVKLAVHQQETEKGQEPLHSADDLELAFRQLIDAEGEEVTVVAEQKPPKEQPHVVTFTDEQKALLIRQLLQYQLQQQYYQQLLQKLLYDYQASQYQQSVRPSYSPFYNQQFQQYNPHFINRYSPNNNQNYYRW